MRVEKEPIKYQLNLTLPFDTYFSSRLSHLLPSSPGGCEWYIPVWTLGPGF